MLLDMDAIFAAIQMQAQAEEQLKAADEAERREQEGGGTDATSKEAAAQARKQATEAKTVAEAAVTVAAAAVPNLVGKAPARPKTRGAPAAERPAFDFRSGIGLGLGRPFGGGFVIRSKKYKAEPSGTEEGGGDSKAAGSAQGSAGGEPGSAGPGTARSGSGADGQDMRAKLEAARQRQQAEAAADADLAAEELDGDDASKFKSVATLAAACGLSAADLQRLLARRKQDGSAASALAWARQYEQRMGVQQTSLERQLADETAASGEESAQAKKQTMELRRVEHVLKALREWIEEELARRRLVRSELDKQLEAAKQAAAEELERKKQAVAAARKDQSKAVKAKQAARKGKRHAAAAALRSKMDAELAAAQAADRADEEKRLAAVKARQRAARQKRKAKQGGRSGAGTPGPTTPGARKSPAEDDLARTSGAASAAAKPARHLQAWGGDSPSS